MNLQIYHRIYMYIEHAQTLHSDVTNLRYRGHV